MADIPSWLNEDFMKTLLEGKTEDKVKILKYHVENAAPAGTNYLSQTLRVKVEFVEDKDTSLYKSFGYIVKIPFSGGYSKELSDKLDFYTKEPAMYKELFPEMSSMLGEDLFPKSYNCPIEGVLILKDLKDEDYVMMDRLSQLDYEHCRVVMETVAKLHASSVACHHKNPNLVESFGKEFFYTGSGSMGKQTKPMIENAFRSIAEVTKELGCDRFSTMLFGKVETCFESSTRYYKPKQTGLNVLVHGDLWTTNILFKHNDSGDVVDAKLIDYQLTGYMSPVLDLLFFIWTSANEEVREHYQEKLYSFYVETLNFHLEKLGCSERLNAEELEKELKSSADLALVQICNLLPFFVAMPEDFISSGDIKSDNFDCDATNQYQKLFRGKHLISLLPTLTKQLMEYFDL